MRDFRRHLCRSNSALNRSRIRWADVENYAVTSTYGDEIFLLQRAYPYLCDHVNEWVPF